MHENVHGRAVWKNPPCGHRFHRACIAEWLKRRQTCPLCRAAAASCPVEPGTEGLSRVATTGAFAHSSSSSTTVDSVRSRGQSYEANRIARIRAWNGPEMAARRAAAAAARRVSQGSVGYLRRQVSSSRQATTSFQDNDRGISRPSVPAPFAPFSSGISAATQARIVRRWPSSADLCFAIRVESSHHREG